MMDGTAGARPRGPRGTTSPTAGRGPADVRMKAGLEERWIPPGGDSPPPAPLCGRGAGGGESYGRRSGWMRTVRSALRMIISPVRGSVMTFTGAPRTSTVDPPTLPE